MKKFIVRTGKSSWVKRKGADRWGRTNNPAEATVFTNEPGVAFRVSQPYTLEPVVP
jgi:hypothetical protein